MGSMTDDTVVAAPLPAGGYLPPPSPPVTTAVADEPPPESWVKPWRLSFHDVTLTDADVTGAHLAALWRVSQRDDWADLSPWRSPLRLTLWLRVMLTTAGVEDLVALRLIASAPLGQIVGALTERED